MEFNAEKSHGETSNAPETESSTKNDSHQLQNNEKLNQRADNYEILTSPTVRMLARQHKIELETVKGSGRKGRIFKSDILEHI